MQRVVLLVVMVVGLFVGPVQGGPMPIENVGVLIQKPQAVRFYGKQPLIQVQVEFGIASWYDCPTKPETVKNPEHRIKDMIYPVAHKTLPFGTLVKAINPANGKKILCRVIDRGPFIPGRIIDLDRPGAKALGIGGVGKVILKIFRLSDVAFAPFNKKKSKNAS